MAESNWKRMESAARHAMNLAYSCRDQLQSALKTRRLKSMREAELRVGVLAKMPVGIYRQILRAAPRGELEDSLVPVTWRWARKEGLEKMPRQ